MACADRPDPLVFDPTPAWLLTGESLFGHLTMIVFCAIYLADGISREFAGIIESGGDAGGYDWTCQVRLLDRTP